MITFDCLCFGLYDLQALDSESIMTRFHSIYEKLNRVLVKTPFHELNISDDVKDEVTNITCCGFGPPGKKINIMIHIASFLSLLFFLFGLDCCIV